MCFLWLAIAFKLCFNPNHHSAMFPPDTNVFLAAVMTALGHDHHPSVLQVGGLCSYRLLALLYRIADFSSLSSTAHAKEPLLSRLQKVAVIEPGQTSLVK